MKANTLEAMVRKSLREALNEKHRPSGIDANGKRKFEKDANGKKQTYYPVNNTKNYAGANGLASDTMYKVGKVQARPSVAGQMNQGTKLGDFVERDKYTENGNSMIVRNPRGEEYQVPNAEFNRKYTLDPNSNADAEGYNTYNAFDKRQISAPIRHNMYKNMPNWGKGQYQKARKGDGHIVNPNNKDSYFIGDKELSSTHVSKPISEERLRNMIKESVKKALKDLN